MPNCPKCGKPVFFAERRPSLGKDWHPWCLKCQLCGKTLNSSRHSEHKGMPYCDVPCYSALFGPGGFGRGGTESHKVFGCVQDFDKQAHRNELIRKIKVYNATLAGSKLTLNYSEANHEVFFEGILRIQWRVKKPIKLLENKFADAQNFIPYFESSQHRFAKKSIAAQKRLVPVPVPSPSADQEVRMKLKRSGFTLLKPVALAKYQSELFTPDETFTTNVFITNQVKSQQVIQQIIKKYQIADSISQFILSVNYFNGGVRILEKDDCPLQIRVNLGPSEAHASISIMHCEDDTDTRLTFQAAQYACLSLQQLQLCLDDIETEEQEKMDMLKEKYRNIKSLIEQLIPAE